MAQRQTRTEYGCEFEFHDVPMDHFPHRPYWESMKGNKVQVWPPLPNDGQWHVYVVDTREHYNMTGDNVEKRAFAVAEGFTRRDHSRVKPAKSRKRHP